MFEGYRCLLRARAQSSAFEPSGPQRIMPTSTSAFAVLRTSRDGAERVLCLVNVTAESAECSFATDAIEMRDEKGFRDLLTGDYVYPSYDGGGRISVSLEPHEVLWLT